jgi:hypothetical protein
MNYFSKINQLAGIELFFTVIIFSCGLFYFHFFLSYLWNQKQLKALDKADDYNLVGFGFWSMLVCVFTLTPLFTDKDSHPFIIYVIFLLFSVVVSKYYYFKSLRKLLKLPAFDKYYRKLVYIFLGISIAIFYKSFELGTDTLFDSSMIMSTNSILRNIIIPYELKTYVKIIFIPNFLFCFVAYIYLIYKSYKREEYLITFGVSFTLLAIIMTNSYHLFQFKYWMPLNVIADVFEMFRLNIAQKNKILQSLVLTQDSVEKLSDLEQNYEEMNLKHKVFKHDLANKFQSSHLNLQRAQRLLDGEELRTDEIKKSVHRALEAQELANGLFRNSDKVVDINLEYFTLKITDFVSIETSLKAESGSLIRFNSIDFNNIFINLIKNAKEANLHNDKSWVKIIFEPNLNENTYEFKVIDSGKFSEIIDVKNIFIPGISSKNDENRGLGLHSIKTIINKHGGDIGVESIDGNTCFHFSVKIPN